MLWFVTWRSLCVRETRLQRHLNEAPGDNPTSGWRPYVDFTENMEQFPGVFSGKSLVFIFYFIHLSFGKCFIIIIMITPVPPQ